MYSLAGLQYFRYKFLNQSYWRKITDKYNKEILLIKRLSYMYIFNYSLDSVNNLITCEFIFKFISRQA